MTQNKDNVIPVTFAVLLHVVLFGSLVVVMDFGRSPDLVIPLAINATLVTENAVVIPPKVEEPPPQPDTREQDRIAAERQKLEEDKRVERERLQKIERDKAESEKRQKQAEVEDERRRAEVEAKRQADIERQRAENERLRKEREADLRQQELDNEAERIEAMSANAKAAYMFAIQQKVERKWVRPASAEVGLECTVKVRQQPGGQVMNVNFGACNGDETIKLSIKNAVFNASPLPLPRDPSVFERNLTLIFKPKE